MTQSYNGIIDTQGEFETVSSLTNITFTENNIYNFWIGNLAQIKVGNYITSVFNDNFTYEAKGEDIYIKTNYTKCQLSILETETN